MVEPAAVVDSTICSDPDAPVSRASGARTILLAGEPRLYLQALSELLDSIPGVSATLVQPGETGRSLGQPAPELIVLGWSATSDGHAELSSSLREAYPGVPLVLLDSGPARDSAERSCHNATTRLSASISVGELLKQLCDPAKPIDARTKHHSSSGPDGQWPWSSLSERELSVLRLVVDGRSNDEIAGALGISRHTVRTHLQHTMAKMLVRSRTELVSVAMRSGMRTRTGPVTEDG